MAKAEGGVLLHLGCGTGLILDELARYSWRLRIGAGRKLQRLLRAHRRTAAEHSLLLLRCSPYRLPLRDKTIDCLLLHNPFVELKDPQAALHEVLRVMDLRGQLICRVEKGQEEALQALLSASGFISYRVGVWWVSMRVDEAQETQLRDQAL
jgi:ubiquinone/menaquinone biosynthesis C-methylase UbiE